MINKSNKLKGVLSEIELDFLGDNKDRKNRDMEVLDHNEKKNVHNKRMGYMEI